MIKNVIDKIVVAAAVILLSSAFSTAAQQAEVVASGEGVALVRAFGEVSFERPVDLQYAPGDNNRLFVVEQPGRIYVFNRSTSDQATLFLDITDRADDTGNEEGLLGLAFHPDYLSNGAFYVNYTAASPDRTVIARFTVEGGAPVDPSDPPVADEQSEVPILEYDQPYANHNGGQIAFGPDASLYIAAGDGGSGGDPLGNGQDPGTLLGAILRINVDHASQSYSIPVDNPFAGNARGYREEAFAYGLRNPWRFSFDPDTGQLWAGDVGQSAYEEIDLIVSGGNYGWNIMEGNHCYSPSTNCDTTGLIPPVVEYNHSVRRSVTGGYVYRGNRVPALYGKYVYADYVTGRIWTLSADDPETADPKLLFDTALNIASFGVDQAGSLYLLAFDGGIYVFQRETS